MGVFFVFSCADLVTFARLEVAVEAGDTSTLRRIVAAGRDIEYLTAEGSLLYQAVKCHAPIWVRIDILNKIFSKIRSHFNDL